MHTDRERAVLFDLDGTLTDSAPGILNGIRYAMKTCGYGPADDKSLRSFLGPPLKEQFASFLSVDTMEADRLVAAYREYYSETGIFENKLYDGVISLLTELDKQGVTIALATSKPELYAKKILDHFQVAHYFDLIGGALMHSRRTKEEVIAHVTDTLKLSPSANVCMVGDRKYDVRAAKEAGLCSIGVLYGYGSRKELAACQPDALAEHVDDLRRVLWNILFGEQ